MGKYDDCLVEMDCNMYAHTLANRSAAFTFGKECFKDAPYFIDVLTFTGNHIWLEGTPEGAPKNIAIMSPDNHKGGPYPKWHRNCDALFFFYGLDPSNINDLGATIEFHIGEGEDELALIFDESRCVHVPKNVRFGPMYVTNFRHNFMEVCIHTAASRPECEIENDFDYNADVERIKKLGLAHLSDQEIIRALDEH
jgi:hypothetical protein